MSKRYAFIPLNIRQKNIAIQDEFVIDYDLGMLYISKGGVLKLLTGLDEEDNIAKAIEEIMGDKDFNIEELVYKINQIKKFKDNLYDVEDDEIRRLRNILKEVIEDEVTLEELFNEKISGIGVLSDNDFDNTYKAKLESIHYNANFYQHPIAKQCNLRFVKSINGKSNHVELTKDDIGSLDVDPNANYYVHPSIPECDLTDKGVSYINGQHGVVTLTPRILGLDLPDMGFNLDGGRYIHLPTDDPGYATPYSTDKITRFFSISLPKPVLGICSVFESKKELASDLYIYGIYGIFSDREPFIYSNIYGLYDVNTLIQKAGIGSFSASNIWNISNRGIEVRLNGVTHYIMMDYEGAISTTKVVGPTYITPTDTGIFYASNNTVVARPYNVFNKLGYSDETYAIRGGSYKCTAEAINDNSQGIISIASDHEVFFAFVNKYGLVRVLFTNKANRYTHNRKGGQLYDL